MNALLRQRRFTCVTRAWVLVLIHGLSVPSSLFALNPRNETLDSNRAVPTTRVGRGLLSDAPAPQSSEILVRGGARSIAFQQDVLSFAALDHVGIRYVVEGGDSDRHEIAYTNLSPSPFCCHVLAYNHDGIWNELRGSISFRVKQVFWQTTGFKILLVFVAIAAMWTAIYLRIAWVMRQFRNRAADRVAERARIARGLQDGFLQEVQGVFLHFKTISRGLSPEDPARAMLDQTLEQAQAVLSSGHQMIDALHVPSPFESMQEDLEVFGGEQSIFYSVPLRIDTIGTMKKLKTGISEELCKIAREAISNAFQHAQANLIEVKLHYNTNSFRIVVSDDGAGIRGRILAYGQRDGHLGLFGMRERAARIGATLRIDSDPATGTQVQIEIKAWRAYGTRYSRFGQWLRLAPDPVGFDE